MHEHLNDRNKDVKVLSDHTLTEEKEITCSRIYVCRGLREYLQIGGPPKV